MIKAVIFDMDGTIIDTEKYYRKYWPVAFKKFGYDMTDAQALELRSLGRPFAPERIKAWFGENVDYPAVKKYRQELIEAEIKIEGIKLKKGAKEILNYLHEKNIVTAIATASDEDRINRYLGAVGLLSAFDKKISATMVKEGKPSPDIYLFACEELGLKPGECLAVEDSPNGIRSAYAAGLKPILVPDQTEPEEEIKPLVYAILDNLFEIKKLIDNQ